MHVVAASGSLLAFLQPLMIFIEGVPRPYSCPGPRPFLCGKGSGSARLGLGPTPATATAGFFPVLVRNGVSHLQVDMLSDASETEVGYSTIVQDPCHCKVGE